MGRERRGKRQYLYFCIAGLIMTVLAACAPPGYRLVKEDDAHLSHARHLLAKGDFEGALRENRKVAAMFPQSPPGDEALFNMGLISLHYAKTKGDIRKALVFFARLEKEFPDSLRTKEAELWVGILENLTKTRQIDIEMKEGANESLIKHGNTHLLRAQQFLAQGEFENALRENQEVLVKYPQSSPGDEALFNMGLINIHYANPKKDIGKALVFFTRLEKEFPESPRVEEAKTWISILQTMEKARQIDNEIEAKKRELRR